MFDSRSPAAMLAISLLSFTAGCSRSDSVNTPSKAPTPAVRQLSRGEVIATIPTSEGPIVKEHLQSILDSHPGMKIGEIERTGSYDYISSSGTGFLLMLEPGEANYDIKFIDTTSGPEASEQLSQILESSPDMQVFSIERTGSHDYISSSGTGLLVILEGNK